MSVVHIPVGILFVEQIDLPNIAMRGLGRKIATILRLSASGSLMDTFEGEGKAPKHSSDKPSRMTLVQKDLSRPKLSVVEFSVSLFDRIYRPAGDRMRFHGHGFTSCVAVTDLPMRVRQVQIGVGVVVHPDSAHIVRLCSVFCQRVNSCARLIRHGAISSHDFIALKGGAA